MKKQYESSDVAKALGVKVLNDIGRQFCRRNLQRSKHRATQRNVARVFEVINGGLSNESRIDDVIGDMDRDLLVRLWNLGGKVRNVRI